MYSLEKVLKVFAAAISALSSFSELISQTISVMLLEWNMTSSPFLIQTVKIFTALFLKSGYYLCVFAKVKREKNEKTIQPGYHLCTLHQVAAHHGMTAPPSQAIGLGVRAALLQWEQSFKKTTKISVCSGS